MYDIEYIICIPTYKRPNILLNKTLRMIQCSHIPSERVYIFVADEHERTSYQSILPSHQYSNIIVGKKGITCQRNFIRSYFPEGTRIVSLDDDIDGLYVLHDKKLKKTDALHTVICTAFRACEKANLKLWGIYPVKNAFYMSEQISYDIKFILGTFYGYINSHDASLILTLPEKEDYEMTIRYSIKDGGVVRLNNTTIQTKFHQSNGGLGCASQRLEINATCAQELKRKYPQFGYVWKRKNGMTEFRLYPSRNIHKHITNNHVQMNISEYHK